MIKVYEYILDTQALTLVQLRQMGLLTTDLRHDEERALRFEEQARAEIISLMWHDKWERVRGALRPVQAGRVFK